MEEKLPKEEEEEEEGRKERVRLRNVNAEKHEWRRMDPATTILNYVCTTRKQLRITLGQTVGSCSDNWNAPRCNAVQLGATAMLIVPPCWRARALLPILFVFLIRMCVKRSLVSRNPVALGRSSYVRTSQNINR